MKTAIYGGSFNPLHLGHLALAAQALKLGYRRVIFVPAKYPPHKTIRGDVSEKDRVTMLEMALEDLPWARIWMGELERYSVSYSIDTVDELKRRKLVDDRPGLIIGDDLVADFNTWKDVNRLAESTTLLLGNRKSEKIPFSYPHISLNNQYYPQSSTGIRQKIASDSSWEQLVPEKVAEYIRSKRLYGCSEKIN